jgi:hypothetical protein
MNVNAGDVPVLAETAVDSPPFVQYAGGVGLLWLRVCYCPGFCVMY